MTKEEKIDRIMSINKAEAFSKVSKFILILIVVIIFVYIWKKIFKNNQYSY